MAHRTSIWHVLAGAVVVILAVMGAPAAATAAFSSTQSAAPQFSAAKLQAPAAAATNVTISCERRGNDLNATITVVAYGTVTNANYHQITVTPPAGQVMTGDLSQESGRVFTSVVNRKDGGSTWTYAIRGNYKVPGTSNIWYGTALTGTLTCL